MMTYTPGYGYDPYGLYGKKAKPKPTGTPVNPPKPPQQQTPGQGAPPPQVPYEPPQQQQYYQDEQRRIAQQYAAQQAAAAEAAMKAQAEAAIEARRQMLADQAAQQQKNFQSQFDPYFVGQTMEDQYDSTRYGGVWGGLVDWFKDRWNYLNELPMLPTSGTGRGFYPSNTVPHEYPWEKEGYYLTQQQINTLMGQTGATNKNSTPQQYQNPPGPRGQKGPYSPQDERQWAYDRDTNNQFQGVTKGYESRLLYGMEDSGGGGGGGGGYPYPSYGGGGYAYPGGGYNFPRYTAPEQVKSWYESMLSWNIPY